MGPGLDPVLFFSSLRPGADIQHPTDWAGSLYRSNFLPPGSGGQEPRIKASQRLSLRASLRGL